MPRYQLYLIFTSKTKNRVTERCQQCSCKRQVTDARGWPQACHRRLDDVTRRTLIIVSHCLVPKFTRLGMADLPVRGWSTSQPQVTHCLIGSIITLWFGSIYSREQKVRRPRGSWLAMISGELRGSLESGTISLEDHSLIRLKPMDAQSMFTRR